MGFMAGVWRLLGADEDESAMQRNIVEYPTRKSEVRHAVAMAEPLLEPPPADKTIFILRPEVDALGEQQFSLKEYAGYLLTEQAAIVDVNAIAAYDEAHAARIVDYLSGVAEAIHGAVYEISKNIFLFSPPSIKLEGDSVIQLEVD